jgi:hypothetical protein
MFKYTCMVFDAVEVLFTPRVNDKRLVPPDPEDKSMPALGWLLSTLIIHPKELGLAEETPAC